MYQYSCFPSVRPTHIIIPLILLLIFDAQICVKSLPFPQILAMLYLSHSVLLFGLNRQHASKSLARTIYHQTDTSLGSFRTIRPSALVMGSCQSCFFGGRPSRRRQAWVRRRPRHGVQQAPRRNHPAGFGHLPPPAHRQQNEIMVDAGG